MRKPRFKARPDAEVAFYHCVSRIVDRAYKLGELEKEVFLRILRQYEAFCGVRVITYCIMSNHFHVLVEVPKRPGLLPSDQELFAKLEALYSCHGLAAVRQNWDQLAALKDPDPLSALRESFFTRMWDLSEFMKSVKQRFSQWYNGQNKRRGTLWEERFRSVLLEGTSQALMPVAAYADLNPI